MDQLLFVSYHSLFPMANFFFYRYHLVQVDEPDLFFEAEKELLILTNVTIRDLLKMWR